MVDALAAGVAALYAALDRRRALADAAAAAAERRPRTAPRRRSRCRPARAGRAISAPRTSATRTRARRRARCCSPRWRRWRRDRVGPALELRDLAGLLGPRRRPRRGWRRCRRCTAADTAPSTNGASTSTVRSAGALLQGDPDATARPSRGRGSPPRRPRSRPSRSAAATASGEVPIRPSSVPAAVTTVTSGASCAISSTSPPASVAECETSTRPTIAQTPSSAAIRPGVSGSSSNRTNRSRDAAGPPAGRPARRDSRSIALDVGGDVRPPQRVGQEPQLLPGPLLAAPATTAAGTRPPRRGRRPRSCSRIAASCRTRFSGARRRGDPLGQVPVEAQPEVAEDLRRPRPPAVADRGLRRRGRPAPRPSGTRGC